MLDASRAVGVASSLVSDTQRDPLRREDADDYDDVRVARASKGQNELSPLAEARANAFPLATRPARRRRRSAPACRASTTGRSRDLRD